MNRQAAEAKLKEYLWDGLVADISEAEEARALAAEIGRHSELSDTAQFRRLFYTLQVALSDRESLAVARLFEEPKRSSWQVRSVPRVLLLLRQHALSLVIRERAVASPCREERRGWHDHGTDAERTVRMVAYFEARLGDPDLVAARRRLSVSRDKVIAHNEAIDPSARERPTWGDAEVLVEFAKEFATTVAWRYLSLDLTAGGEYLPTHSARETQRAFRLLLDRMSSQQHRECQGPEFRCEVPPAEPPPEDFTLPTVEARVAKLDELRSNGLITEREYQGQRRRIL